MKNVTITIEEKVAEFAKVYAARQNKSLSALISGYLRSLMEASDERRRAEQSYFGRGTLFDSKNSKWSREDLYDRKVLR